MRQKKSWFLLAPLVILALVFGGAFNASAVKKATYQAPVTQKTAPENTLLQFSAGGHILGFKPDKVYFASFDHAIVEEFIGTKGVMPAGEAGHASKEASEGRTVGQPVVKKGGAPALGKVIYKDLWQGITLKYEAKEGGIAESTYLLEPEAEVKDIRLRYNVPVGIKKDGTLRFKHESDRGYFILSAPKAWQDINGKRTHIEVAFADYGDNTIGFRLGEYNRQYPVVIDPTYSWHTFYGSASAADVGFSIAVDTSGNAYVCGVSGATWNGPGAVAPLNAHSGNFDIVVLKLNTAGAYQWHTFYGPAGGEGGCKNAVDTSGNVYVATYSNATWNGPGAVAPLNAYSGSNDIVVLKLNTAGAYQWHTFYGSASAADVGFSIAVDTSGNAYVCGVSGATWNGPGAVAPLNAYSGINDIVVLKLNTAGAYQWHTFYGSVGGDDIGYGIAVDTSGNVYVTGNSGATWNGPGAVAPLNAYSGNADIVVLKLNTAGAYQWHTFYGSVGATDYAYGIAVDTSGNVYVTGNSNATWNGPGAVAPLNAYSGISDIVVLKLNTAGAYQWHTFYGSVGGGDYGTGIAVDTSSNVFVTGYSYATWNGPGAVAPLNAYTGSNDIVVLKLNTAGAYQWHTFYGSVGGDDVGYSIAVNTGGNVHVTGYSSGTWNGPGAVAPLNAYSGGYDIFVLKHAVPITAPNVAVPTMSEWGMIIFMLFAGLGAMYYMRRRRA